MLAVHKLWLGFRRFGRWHLLCAAFFVSATWPAAARLGSPPQSFRQQVHSLAEIQQFGLPPTDTQAELAADEKTGAGVPMRFTVPHAVTITPATHGTWEQLTNGRLWRLRIQSAGATDLNLGFTRFWLPEGATLHVISESESYYQGPYTSRDNNPYGQLWTPVIPGDRAVIELFVPAQARQQPQLVLGHIGAGYRNWFHEQNLSVSSQAEADCNIDVACPIAAAWSNEVRSVALYSVYGTFACTGTLITDVAGDFRSYFLTANHCGVDADNAPTMVVYWNYQSTNCGTHGPGSLAQNQSGATFRAGKADVDFTLVELDEMPDPSFGVYYSGWDRSGLAPAGGVGIHHPQCDVKAISFSSNALTTVDSCIGNGGTNTHWQVIWSLGITEPGSSGSGIWDPATHRLVGTLSGGGVSCANPSYPDCYGKFSVAWNSGSSPAERLADWLDPQNTGATNVPGLDPMKATILIPAGTSLLAESYSPTNGAIDPGETVTVSFALENYGGVATTNLIAKLLCGNGVSFPSAQQNYGAITQGLIVARAYTFTAEGTCGGTIKPVLQLQDGSRNLGTASFNFIFGVPVPTPVLAENFDEATPPALPVGWQSSASGASSSWITTSAQADTPPNSAFATDPGAVGVSQLLSPSIQITSASPQLTFRHSYNTETGYDGGVLEISINGGSFVDILTAGGSFVTNGYNGSIACCYQNPLAGRLAWTGNSGGFITTIVNLPAAAVGQSIQLRWRLGSDNSNGALGWFVDSVSLTQSGYTCWSAPAQPLIVNPHLTTPGNLAFSYNSVTGQTYFVETTTNLTWPASWRAIQTNLGDGSSLSYTDAATAFGQRYFRMRTQ